MIVTQNSDVTIAVVGLNENLEGEEGDAGNSYASGDKLDLSLPQSQQALLHAVAETAKEEGKKTVLCLMAGSDLDLSYAMENFDAVLMLWYPGAQGGLSAARILFGDVSPSGKLCVTFYDPDYPLPEFTDYSMKGRTYRYMDAPAQYPFGYGLTYGDVIVTDARLLKDEEAAGQGEGACRKLSVSFRNRGAVLTKEVIEVYVDPVDSPYRTPNPRLAGFCKIEVPAGGEGSCVVRLDPDLDKVVDEEGRLIPADGKILLYTGVSGPDRRSVELTGKEPLVLEL
jgi:beta-glucosidase